MEPPGIPTVTAPLAEWLGAIAAPTPTCAGGTAAALAGALAAASVEMVAGLTLARERYAAEHERARAAAKRVAGLGSAMADLARRDAEAFARFGSALALPRGTEAEVAAREAAKHTALQEGAWIQLALLAHLAETADLGAGLAERGLASAFGDAATAVFLAAGAARSAYWAARGGLTGADDPEARSALETGRTLLDRVEAAEGRIRRLASERIR